MIEYFEGLTGEQQEEVKEAVSLLWNQTFVLERKWSRRQNRMVMNPEFRLVNQHLAFLKAYFAISGVELLENTQTGIFYLRGEAVIGDKLSRLSTLYVLILKLIYDEQMAAASTSVEVRTRLSDIHERLASFRLLRGQPAPTEVKKSLRLLKKYQVIELLDSVEDSDGEVRILIYPTIHTVLLGDDVKALLDTFKEMEKEDAEAEI